MVPRCVLHVFNCVFMLEYNSYIYIINFICTCKHLTTGINGNSTFHSHPLPLPSFSEVPGPPAIVTVVSSQAQANMTVEWTPPVASQHHELLQYSASCTPSNSSEGPAQNFTSTDNKTHSTYFSEFLSYTLYNCCVAAINAMGTGNSTCNQVTSPEYRELSY